MSEINNASINNIKSKYILKQIFDNLHKIKMLNIIRYNNNLKNNLEITLNDYVECRYIEIDIIPVKNKSGKFINLTANEEYYHLYFNNNKKK